MEDVDAMETEEDVFVLMRDTSVDDDDDGEEDSLSPECVALGQALAQTTATPLLEQELSEVHRRALFHALDTQHEAHTALFLISGGDARFFPWKNVEKQLQVVKGPCGRQWDAGSRAYRCHTCQKLSVTAFCEECFHEGGHSEHDYVMYISSNGGSCDCGLEATMQPEGFCRRHRQSSQDQPDTLPERYVQRMNTVIGWCWEVLIKGQEGDFKLQEAAAKLLNDLAIMHPVLRKAVASGGTSNFKDRLEPLFQLIIAEAFHDGLCNLVVTLMVEPAFKHEGQKAFVSAYPGIVALVTRPHSEPSRELLLTRHLRVSVQMFAILDDPEAQARALRVILQALDETFTAAERPLVRNQPEWNVLSHEHQVVAQDTCWAMFMDIRDLLLSSTTTLCPLLLDRDAGCLAAYCSLIRRLELLDLEVRALGNHVEYEQDWVLPYTIVSQAFVAPIRVVCKWLERAPVEALQKAVSSLFDVASSSVEDLMRYLHDNEQTCLTGTTVCAWELADARVDAFSLHIPLHRCCALSLAYAINSSVLRQATSVHAVCEFLGVTPDRLARHVFQTVHHPLRLFATRSQVRTGTWVRNGTPAAEKMWFYSYMRDTDLWLDLDLFSLQFAFAFATDVNSLVDLVIDRFGLTEWIGNAPSEGLDQVRAGWLEDMWLFLVSLLCERVWLDKSSLQHAVQRKMVSTMATGPKLHSELVRGVRPLTYDEDDWQPSNTWEELLEDVAEQKVTADGRKEGPYSLKPEGWDLLDMSHVALHGSSRRDVLRALENLCRSPRGAPTASATSIRPPFLVPAQMPPVMAGLNRILESERMFELLHTTLKYIAAGHDHSSSLLAYATLHVLHLCLLHTPSAEHMSIHTFAVKPLTDGSRMLDVVLRLTGCTEIVCDQQYLGSLITLFQRDADCAAIIAASGTVTSKNEMQKKERKRRGQARQAALLEKFKKQQQAFVQANPAATSKKRARTDEPGEASRQHPTLADTMETDGAAGTSQQDSAAPVCSICFRELCDSPDVPPEEIPQLICRVDDTSCIRGTSLVRSGQDARIEDSVTAWDALSLCVMLETCGHRAHQGCLTSYRRSRRRAPRTTVYRDRPVNDSTEFTCPVCRQLGHTGLAVELQPGVYQPSDLRQLLTCTDWFSSVCHFLSAFNELCPLIPLEVTEPITHGKHGQARAVRSLMNLELYAEQKPGWQGQLRHRSWTSFSFFLRGEGQSVPELLPHSLNFASSWLRYALEVVVNSGTESKLLPLVLSSVLAKAGRYPSEFTRIATALRGQTPSRLFALSLDPVQVLVESAVFLSADEFASHFASLAKLLHGLGLVQVCAAAAARACRGDAARVVARGHLGTHGAASQHPSHVGTIEAGGFRFFITRKTQHQNTAVYLQLADQASQPLRLSVLLKPKGPTGDNGSTTSDYDLWEVVLGPTELLALVTYPTESALFEYDVQISVVEPWNEPPSEPAGSIMGVVRRLAGDRVVVPLATACEQLPLEMAAFSQRFVSCCAAVLRAACNLSGKQTPWLVSELTKLFGYVDPCSSDQIERVWSELPSGIVDSWLEQYQNVFPLKSPTDQPVILRDALAGIELAYAVKPPALVQLPKQFDEVVRANVSSTCATCHEQPKASKALLCLHCGKVVCHTASCDWSPHAPFPGAGSRQMCTQGLCLRLDLFTSEVLVFGHGFSASLGSVYLDEWGEEDIGLKRGKRLTLSPVHMARVQNAWMERRLLEMMTKYKNV